MTHNNSLYKIIAGAAAIALVSFFAGSQYGKTSGATDAMSLRGNGNPAGQFRGDVNGMPRGGATPGMGGVPRQGGGLVVGEVVTSDTTGLTLKLRDGSSKIIFLQSSTQILKTTAGAMSDITPGVPVSIQGTANPDGSITAQSIQLRAGIQAVQ